MKWQKGLFKDTGILETMVHKVIKFIKEIVPIVILYMIIKFIFGTTHLQTFIIVTLLLVAITKTLNFMGTLIDSEISRH